MQVLPLITAVSAREEPAIYEEWSSHNSYYFHLQSDQRSGSQLAHLYAVQYCIVCIITRGVVLTGDVKSCKVIMKWKNGLAS